MPRALLSSHSPKACTKGKLMIELFKCRLNLCNVVNMTQNATHDVKGQINKQVNRQIIRLFSTWPLELTHSQKVVSINPERYSVLKAHSRICLWLVESKHGATQRVQRLIIKSVLFPFKRCVRALLSCIFKITHVWAELLFKKRKALNGNSCQRLDPIRFFSRSSERDWYVLACGLYLPTHGIGWGSTQTLLMYEDIGHEDRTFLLTVFVHDITSWFILNVRPWTLHPMHWKF